MRPVPEKGIPDLKVKVPIGVLLLLGLAILFWASAFVGIRSALSCYSPQTLALLRFLIASIVLGIYARIIKMPLPHKSDIPFFALAGFIGITIYHLTLNIGEKTVTAGTASFLISSVPIFTALFSLFMLHQKLNKWGWLGILISFSGIALISFSESGFGKLNIGTFLILIASCSGSLYVIFQKRLLEKYTPMEVASYTFWFGTLFMLFFLPKLLQEIQTATTIATLEVVYLGIFPAAVAYVIWTYVLPKFPSATHITSYLYVSPILTMIIAFFWIQEIPTIASIIGGFITLSGVILTNTVGR